MKKFIMCLPLIFLSACGGLSRTTADWTGYDTQCVKGVTYIQFVSGATVMVDRNGNPVPCGD